MRGGDFYATLTKFKVLERQILRNITAERVGRRRGQSSTVLRRRKRSTCLRGRKRSTATDRHLCSSRSRLRRSDTDNSPGTNGVVETSVIFACIKVDIHCQVIAFLNIKLLQAVFTPNGEKATARIGLVVRLQQEILRHPGTTVILSRTRFKSSDYFSLYCRHGFILLLNDLTIILSLFVKEPLL